MRTWTRTWGSCVCVCVCVEMPFDVCAQGVASGGYAGKGVVGGYVEGFSQGRYVRGRTCKDAREVWWRRRTVVWRGCGVRRRQRVCTRSLAGTRQGRGARSLSSDAPRRGPNRGWTPAGAAGDENERGREGLTNGLIKLVARRSNWSNAFIFILPRTRTKIWAANVFVRAVFVESRRSQRWPLSKQHSQ